MPMTKNIQVLINYYCVMVLTGTHVDKTEVLPPHLQPARRYANLRDIALGAIMQDKVEFTSLMVIMSSRMVHLSRIALTGLARPEYYMHLALAAVRERMLDFQARGVPGDNILVHGMHSLALSDWICQRFEAASTHVRAVKVLLPLLNLNDPLDMHIAQGIFNIDQMIAIETGWLPEFPLTTDPGPLDEARMSLIREDLEAFKSGRREPVIYPHSPVPNASRLSNAMMSHQVDFLADASTSMDFSLGSGFERALEADVIHPELASILFDLLDVLSVAKLVWRTPTATRDDADWMCKRARAICHRLLAVPILLPFPETSAHAAKTEALRLALLLMVLRCTNRMSFRAAQPNMRRLQRALSLHGIGTNWSASARAPASTSAPSAEHPERPRSSGPDTDTDTDTYTDTNKGADPYDGNALLLWILMTGHFSAQGEPEEELWFLMRAAYVAERHLGISDLDGLRSVMGEYLYSRTQQERSLIVVSLHLSGSGSGSRSTRARECMSV
ncbi:hypothetical protein G647_07995 [Cladophialophora carrionii CBS 160.54]|uniref:Transcription factor domain-containing protein n=1 Tax=Cladophialophora carrionii CBS 160.54 TaxID=1279043 RepID=V9D5S6_9EURO|nr:uncharacterized protein G647_07995 [Cladophialophora carrionii CBS 160.54]ETI21648.1 hypothetical protein G647_07995 [Cladophialophora carrionii CBS 160.54]